MRVATLANVILMITLCMSAFADYTPQGTRLEFTTTQASDMVGTLTNSITHYDFLGRVVATQTPAFGGGWLTTSNFYAGAGSRLARSTSTGEPDTLYIYNKMGELIGETRNGISILTESSYETIAGSTWRVIQQSRVVDTTTNIISTTREQLNNLAAGTLAHTVTIAANGSTTTATTTFDQNTHRRTTIHQTDDATPIVTVTLYGRVIEQTTLSEKRYNYFDPLGRICGYSIHDPQTDQILYSHQAELDMSGTPTNQITQYGALTITGASAYDMLGREITSTDALGHATTNSYDALGNLTQRTGATYPVRYTYDTIGRIKSRATTRDDSNWNITQWLYDHAGAVTNKIHADNSAVNYTYTSNYKPLRTTLARGEWKENSYNHAGQLESVTYSDDTPDAFYDYSNWGYLTSFSNTCASYTIDNNSLGIATNVVADICTHQLLLNKELDNRMRTDHNNKVSRHEILFIIITCFFFVFLGM